MHRMLALLWRRVISAACASQQSAARMPFTLFAAIEMPMPVEQIRMPYCAPPSATQCATFAPYTA